MTATDLIILGAGPAGLTAGMYAARAGIPLKILEKGISGGQMACTEYVDNYPGFEEPILGADLAQRMETHAKRFGAEIEYGDVAVISPEKDGYHLETDSGDKYSCRALILATGAAPVKMGVPGELDLAGKGVSYCAVCDGPFFRDFEIAVIGGGDSAVEEAVYLTRFASKVHIVHRRDQFRAIKEIQDKAFAEPKIRIHWNSVPIHVKGSSVVDGLVIRSIVDGSENELPVGGVFFYVGIKPNSDGFQALVKTDPRGFVITDEHMACSRPGTFAAGDIRSKSLRQISTAVGDGAIAAYSAMHYLEKK